MSGLRELTLTAQQKLRLHGLTPVAHSLEIAIVGRCRAEIPIGSIFLRGRGYLQMLLRFRFISSPSRFPGLCGLMMSTSPLVLRLGDPVGVWVCAGDEDGRLGHVGPTSSAVAALVALILAACCATRDGGFP